MWVKVNHKASAWDLTTTKEALKLKISSWLINNFNKEAKFTPVEQGTETFTTTVSLTLPKIERKLFEFEAEKLYPKWIKLRAKRII